MNMTTHPDAALAALLIEPILHTPGTCTINHTPHGQASFLTIRPAVTDIQKIVGKQGSNIRALETLVAHHGRIHGRPTRLVLSDAKDGPPHQPTPRIPDAYPSQGIAMAQAYLRAIKQPDTIHAVKREATEGHGQHPFYVLAIAAEMPKAVWSSLSRWIAAVSLRHGGFATLEAFKSAAV